MTDLVEFLRARLDEDEERARFVQRERGDRALPEVEPWRLSWHDEYDLLCIEPSRALADVDAKRRIVDEHEPSGNYAYRDDSTPACGTCGDYTAEWPCDTLKLLALPYVGHPDYDESWRP